MVQSETLLGLLMKQLEKRHSLFSGIGKQVNLELVMAIFDGTWREHAGK